MQTLPPTIPVPSIPASPAGIPAPPASRATDPPEARAALLLQTLFDTAFDLHAVGARFTAVEIADLSMTPKFQQRLAALISLSDTTLTLRAAAARSQSMAALESVLPDAQSPVEKRRTATALLRATAAPLIPPPRPPREPQPAPSAGPAARPPMQRPQAPPTSRPRHQDQPCDPDVPSPHPRPNRATESPGSPRAQNPAQRPGESTIHTIPPPHRH